LWICELSIPHFAQSLQYASLSATLHLKCALISQEIEVSRIRVYYSRTHSFRCSIILRCILLYWRRAFEFSLKRLLLRELNIPQLIQSLQYDPLIDTAPQEELICFRGCGFATGVFPNSLRCGSMTSLSVLRLYGRAFSLSTFIVSLKTVTFANGVSPNSPRRCRTIPRSRMRPRKSF
jgi:hypothetical protein